MAISKIWLHCVINWLFKNEDIWKLDEALEVEEGDILSFHFNNYTQQDFHVYIFCFEETGWSLSMNDFHKYSLNLYLYAGNVKFVTVDIAKHPYRTQENKTVFPAMKKFLQAYIPQGTM